MGAEVIPGGKISCFEQFDAFTNPATSSLRNFAHSTELRGKGYPHSAKAARGEDLEVEEPVACWDCTTFDFHPTLASVLGPTLIGH